MSEKRKIIVDAARNLFMEQGYSKTTILQIADASGFQTGSIYHFFKNKEDIFKAAVLEREVELRAAITEYYKQQNMPTEGAYIYCMITYLILYLSEHYENMLDYNYQSYHLASVVKAISEHATERNLSWFGDNFPKSENAYTEMYLRTMGISGVIYSILTDMVSHHYVSFRIRVRQFFKIALTTYGVSEEEIKTMTSDTNLDLLERDVRGVLDTLESSTSARLSI